MRKHGLFSPTCMPIEEFVRKFKPVATKEEAGSTESSSSTMPMAVPQSWLSSGSVEATAETPVRKMTTRGEVRVVCALLWLGVRK